MTYSFGTISKQRLARAHPLLQKLANEAIKHTGFMVGDTNRGRVAQEKAFKEHKSKVHFGDSAHNWDPSVAYDLIPFPIDWNDSKRFIKLQLEFIKPIAKDLGIPIRQGCDWNMNGILTDEHFVDLPHVELHPWRTWAKECKLYLE